MNLPGSGKDEACYGAMIVIPPRLSIAFTLLLIMVCTLALADTPLQLDERSAHELQVRVSENGESEIHTTGGDPWIITLPLPENVDLTRDYVLAFDYFSLNGTDSLQVFAIPPGSELASVTVDGLGRSEGWTTRGIDLRPALAEVKRKVKALRIDFGRQADRTIQMRNLRLRPLTDQESEFERRRVEQKQHEAEAERNLRAYLDAKFPGEVTQVRADDRQITIEGTTGKEAGTFVLLEVPIYAEITDLKTLPKAGAITPGEDGHFTMSVERMASESDRSRDRIFSRWAIARQEGEAVTLASHARYCDLVAAKWNLPEEKPRGRKGVGALAMSRPLSDLDDLGIGSATVNISLGSFMRATPGEGHIPFDYAGKTWYADERVLQHLDQTMLEAFKRHIIVSAIILVDQASARSSEFSRLVAHPDAHPSGHFAMPNVTSPEGHAAYAAALDFLARRYSQPDGEHGRIHHWIVHNEVDAGWEWTNAGEKTALRYLDLYHRSMRTVHLIARQYNAHAKAFISLTHYWTQKASRHFYPSRDLLDLLLDFSHAEGDFDWAIAYHPYPQDLRNPRTWEDRLARFTFDTPQITFKNIEVLDAWVRQPRVLFQGKQPRTIHFTEQGPNSPDYSEKSLREQAASMAYLWKKLERLNTIEVFHFHNWVDNRGEGGLRIGLRRFPDDQEEPLGKKPVWHVFRALDTPQEDEATEFAKQIVGVGDWSEVLYTGEIK